MHFDISEQCVDEQNVPINCDSYVETKPNEETHLDTRTFDEIMLSAFDECNSKSYQIRSEALTTVCTQLQHTHNPDFLNKHRDRLSTIVFNALESNVPCEIDAAASVISLVSIQLPDSNRFGQNFQKQLRSTLSNSEYQKSSIRFAAYRVIEMITFLHETNGYRIAKIMNELQDIFVHKADHDNFKKPNYDAQVAALETWTFLMTLIPAGCDVTPIFRQHAVGNFLTLLEHRSNPMRTACAKAIAAIIECGVAHDKYCLESHMTKIVDQLAVIIRAYNSTASDIKSPMEVRQYLEVS